MQNVEIRWFGDLQRLEVRPGDKFVLSVEGLITDEVARHMRQQWAKFAGDGVEILIIQGGMKLGVFGDEKKV